MKKRLQKSVITLLGLILFATMATGQSLNKNRYITLTVQSGKAISLGLRADATGTPIQIVSGSKTYNVNVGTNWTGRKDYSAGGTTMTIYGDLTVLFCSENKEKITAIDVSHNTALENLYCSDTHITKLDVSRNTGLENLDCSNTHITSLDVSQQNTALSYLRCYDTKMNTQALDLLYCSLPSRTGKSAGSLVPVNSSTSANHASVLASNGSNATKKNWKVQYYSNSASISTTGTYKCKSLNKNRYITLTVQSGKEITLNLQAAAAGTPIQIVSGSKTYDVTVGTSSSGFINYTAGDTKMTIYGDLTVLYCIENKEKITAIDVSHNTALENLYCSDTHIKALDVSNNTALEWLNCYNTHITALDVSRNIYLKRLYCHGTKMNTQALDLLYCSLPSRTGKLAGEIYPVQNSTSANYASVLASNASNAKVKNWKVQDYSNSASIPTTGTYKCKSVNMNRYITLTVQSGKAISLDLQGAAAGTPIQIVSGSKTYNFTVGRNWTWTDKKDYTAGGTTMTIYGDLIGFSCSNNKEKITAINVSRSTDLSSLYCYDTDITSLDVSNNTSLEWLGCENTQITALDVSQNRYLEELSCYGTKMNTQALDLLYCSLPNRTGGSYLGRIYPVYNPSSANHASVLASNAKNAQAKKWIVGYYNSDAPIYTSGTYKCKSVNKNRYITLTVQSGKAISLRLQGTAAGTPIQIVSGSKTYDVTVGTKWTDYTNYTTGGTTMTIYGDLSGFNCEDNKEKITKLNVSKNTALEKLLCGNTHIPSLDVSQNTALLYLDCYGTKMTTQALDLLYCSLPSRTGKSAGEITLIFNSDRTSVLASNGSNAINKNWNLVEYYQGNSGAYDIPIPAVSFTGKYKCGTSVGKLHSTASVKLYPNPVGNTLHIVTEAGIATAALYDIMGKEVLRIHTATDKIDVSALSPGIYILRLTTDKGVGEYKVVKE